MEAPGSARTTRATSSRVRHVSSSGAATTTSFLSFMGSFLLVERSPKLLLRERRIEAGQALRGEGVRNGVPDRGGNPDRTALPDPLRAQGVQGRRSLDEGTRNRWHLNGRQQAVVRERCRPELSGLVVDRLFDEALAEPLHRAAHDLSF